MGAAGEGESDEQPGGAGDPAGGGRARKISGGTQSAAGSTTRRGLQSLFATWERRGRTRWPPV